MTNSDECAAARRSSAGYPDPDIFFCDADDEDAQVIVSRRQLQVAPVMKAFRDRYGYEPKRFRYLESWG